MIDNAYQLVSVKSRLQVCSVSIIEQGKHQQDSRLVRSEVVGKGSVQMCVCLQRNDPAIADPASHDH